MTPPTNRFQSQLIPPSYSQFSLTTGRNPLSNSPKFQGYRLAENGEASLFLPGYWDPQDSFKYKVNAVVVPPGKASGGKDVANTHTVPLSRKGHYWVSDQTVPLGSLYRIQVEETYHEKPLDVIDNLQVKKIGSQVFNVVSPFEKSSPQKSVVMADIFQDSVVSRKKLLAYLEAYQNGDAYHFVRNHFNQYEGDELGLKEVLPILKKAGFSGLLLKPFIGGDNLSSHRYWTVDPYSLNKSFSSKEAFKDILSECLRNDMKLFSDGAFVNFGLNSPQLTSNFYDGFRSPYWDWFQYDTQNAPKEKNTFPKEAYEKHSLGILPMKQDPVTGHSFPNYDAVTFRIKNDPEGQGYDPNRPTFIQYFNHETQTADGQPRVPNRPITAYDDSIQTYEFRMTPAELRHKRSIEKTLTSPEDKKLLYLETSGLRLASPSKDGLPKKWVGQIDVAKGNMKNPEVQEFIMGSVAYWTGFVQNHYVDQVARALETARKTNPTGSPQQWIDSITESDPPNVNKADGRRSEDPHQPLPVLPPISQQHLDTLTSKEIQQALTLGRSAGGDVSPAHGLTQAIAENYPLSTLPLPLFFKSVLGHPKLKNQLIKEEFPLVFKLAGWLLSPVLYPLQKIPFLKSVFDQVEDLLRPTSFHKKLERRLDEAIQTLPKEQQEHLKHSGVLPLLVESMAEKLYLTLLTGQEKSDATLAENGFYKTVPQAIVHSDPETAKDLLIPFLKNRLKSLSKEQLAAWTQEKLTGLNPEMVSLASALLNKREFGLNWRIDAAKDVADFDRVLESKTPEEKIRRFEEEIEFVKTFWTKMTQKVKQIFEKSMTIAELTDFELLSNGEVAKKSFEKLFDANVFTSTPNMSYMYNTPTQLVHYAPRPDEFGNSQMKPSQFLSALKSMSQSVPFPALRMYQNLTSSHDYPNTSHALLINPAIATMDLLKWWGVKDDLKEVSTELTTKPGFSDERDLLSHHGINDLGFVLERLNQAVQSPTFQSRLSPEVYEYFSENQKKKSKDGGQTIEWLGATPTPIKLRFLDEAFRFIKPEELGVSDDVAHQVLKNVLKERIAEPSEARAMRAVISNTLLNLDWLSVAKRAGFPEERAPYLKQTLSPLMHQGIKGAIKTYGRHWGYQPLEIAMDNAFKAFPANWQDAYPGAGQKIQAALRDQIYQQAMIPVLDKLHRIITLQVSVPGNPSIYLPDLFGQTGSELVKNMFVQNRHLIRYDYLDKDSDKPYLHNFFDQVQEVIQLRKKYPVLNDGIVLEPKITPHLDDDGVVPIIRDNGVDQVIMLVNTGKPNSIGWDKIGEGPSYKEIKLDPNLKEIYNYTLDLSTLALTPGETRYVDPENGEAFMLDSKSRLVKVNNPQEGIDIRRPYRMLVRQN